MTNEVPNPCEDCGRPMRPLFLSLACDFCDGLKTPEYFRGFAVLLQNRPLPREEYVFATEADAEKWLVANDFEDAKIREVLSEYEFEWRESNGRIKDIRLARKLVEIFPDKRCVPKPFRAFLS